MVSLIVTVVQTISTAKFRVHYVSTDASCTKDVSFLLDSGAGSSIMCVEGFMPGQKEFVSRVYGIGGSKGSAAPIMAQCTLSSKVYDHPLRPVYIEGESALVILGRDFMAKEGGTFFDWANHRIMLGEDWVYYLDSASKDGGDFKPLVNNNNCN